MSDEPFYPPTSQYSPEELNKVKTFFEKDKITKIFIIFSIVCLFLVVIILAVLHGITDKNVYGNKNYKILEKKKESETSKEYKERIDKTRGTFIVFIVSLMFILILPSWVLYSMFNEYKKSN